MVRLSSVVGFITGWSAWTATISADATLGTGLLTIVRSLQLTLDPMSPVESIGYTSQSHVSPITVSTADV